MSTQHVDKNLNVEKSIEKDDLVWRSVLDAPFSVHGVRYEDGKFRRLPEGVAASVSEKVLALHANASGGRVRFKTDSATVAISVRYSRVCRMPHFALSGSAGLDMYVKEEGKSRECFCAAFMPPYDMTDGYESRQVIQGGKRMREITVNMPLYSDVTELYIGLEPDAVLLPAGHYRTERPIVYYGNSITQGACASRPGNTFAAYASRAVGCDFINLGFSGAGLAETEMAEYVAGLDMQILVYDYDHNAPSPDYLEATHERMFRTVREKNPALPVVMMTRTSFAVSVEQREKRKQIIRETYERARAGGDGNVYFLDGSEIYGELWGEATVERTHPGDLGQILIARALVPVLEKILDK